MPAPLDDRPVEALELLEAGVAPDVAGVAIGGDEQAEELAQVLLAGRVELGVQGLGPAREGAAHAAQARGGRSA